MTCSQCKKNCERWQTCEGCRSCKWLIVCKNAYRYLNDQERGLFTEEDAPEVPP